MVINSSVITQISKRIKFLSIPLITALAVTACSSDNQQQVQEETVTPPVAQTASQPQTSTPGIDIDNDDIAGVVSSANGPEAGVWVIAETDDFETRYNKIVATDDQGRYLVPDLPDANYRLWVRGYGLVDSTKVDANPGNIVDLTAEVAPDKKAAAEIYPAAYWYAMMKLPEESELASIDGGLHQYLARMKNSDCVGCHQMGNKATRTFPEGLVELDLDSEAAWIRRISSGQAGARMMRPMGQLNGLPIKYLADWTDRVAAGELPHADPQRPVGQERNIVVTIRDWMAEPYHYVHDLSGTDRRNPTVNGYGPLYGAPELSTDQFPILDPVNNTATTFDAPVMDPDTPSTGDDPVTAPSFYWGEERIWDSQANAHNPMLDQDGRVWYT
ncbi:MAG: carboxypeptidase regulatory-like domain-containing protein, partial [Gammaproteobacteria bacterium]|nr:carboxypeptidase regulatory-like domain-containing protein [Gammaproteobacteria bacterium]